MLKIDGHSIDFDGFGSPVADNPMFAYLSPFDYESKYVCYDDGGDGGASGAGDGGDGGAGSTDAGDDDDDDGANAGEEGDDEGDFTGVDGISGEGAGGADGLGGDDTSDEDGSGNQGDIGADDTSDEGMTDEEADAEAAAEAEAEATAQNAANDEDEDDEEALASYSAIADAIAAAMGTDDAAAAAEAAEAAGAAPSDEDNDDENTDFGIFGGPSVGTDPDGGFTDEDESATDESGLQASDMQDGSAGPGDMGQDDTADEFDMSFTTEMDMDAFANAFEQGQLEDFFGLEANTMSEEEQNSFAVEANAAFNARGAANGGGSLASLASHHGHLGNYGSSLGFAALAGVAIADFMLGHFTKGVVGMKGGTTLGNALGLTNNTFVGTPNGQFGPNEEAGITASVPGIGGLGPSVTIGSDFTVNEGPALGALGDISASVETGSSAL